MGKDLLNYLIFSSIAKNKLLSISMLSHSMGQVPMTSAFMDSMNHQKFTILNVFIFNLSFLHQAGK